MTEEIKNKEATDAGLNSATPVEPQDQGEVTPELSPIESQALEQGWVPQDQWQGDPDDWRPAKEFVERGELYKSIHTTRRELKNTQQALTSLQRHHQYVFQKAHEQALKDLRLQRREAMKEQDFERVDALENKIEQTQAQFQREAVAVAQATTPPPQPNIVPEFQEWVDRNQWYLKDPVLKEEAEAAGFIYLNNGGDKANLLAHVERKVKQKFPEKFGTKRSAPNAVAGVDRTGRKSNSKDVALSDVPEHMRDVIRNFTQASGMSEADYIKELKKIGAF